MILVDVLLIESLQTTMEVHKLREFDREYERLSVEETLKRVRSIKRDVLSHLQQCHGGEEAAQWLGIVAYLTTKGVRHGLHQSFTDDSHASRAFQELTFTLEDAVMTAHHVLEGSVQDGRLNGPTSNSSVVRTALLRVFSTSPPPPTTEKDRIFIAVWVDITLLLSLCWIQRGDRADAMQLLECVVEHGATNDDTDQNSAWIRFVLGLLYALDRREMTKALTHMRRAITVVSQDQQQGQDGIGVVYYWYAVVLSHQGHHADAIEQLHHAVRCNYEVVASLNLQAIIALQSGDTLEASDALQRSIEVGVGHEISMYNYATLLKTMTNGEAQYQMLRLYLESLDAVDAGQEMVGDAEPPRAMCLLTRDAVSTVMPNQLHSIEEDQARIEMAMAAVDCGSFQDARRIFDALFGKDTVAWGTKKQDALRNYIYVLLQCERPREALQLCETSVDNDDIIVAFYKADALLCLERVDECVSHLQTTIEPLLQRLCDQDPSILVDDQGRIAELRVQLENNLAMALVCQSDVDQALTLLHKCSAEKGGSSALPVKFNLTLLLWKMGRRDAACALWFETRGWDLRMDAGDLKEQQRAIDFVAQIEDEALSSSGSLRISSHVSDDAPESGDVNYHQLRYVDALILHHWSASQSSLVAETVAQYVDYLQNVATCATASE